MGRVNFGPSLAIVAVISLSGCNALSPEDPRLGQELSTPTSSIPIQTQPSEDDFDAAMHARYNIEVYSGGGIPGSPGANFRVANYRQVLQTIVDRCELGRTVLVQATDGVSLLAIMDNDLSDKQIACIKDSEQPGVTLRDWGTRG